ncbi:hypothetical protein LTR99_002588 [Exophiala xenobiotica]|uniref:Uncharacterized protein n=1 Tax=Vermiconidia calcicola TaxID=1690605 RepID=A0AAV9QJF4_9PEZI|nr:hypothetical protein H2202_000966 [Exophiala xenobiotica]KAK5537063.1 hypothetical protein LTR23_007760 [Chaetothyriales sp. CCFEE 6169]KAK5542075.1 hypothetical protein LTR25_001960 [Vermiconidia calcicola]KAK5195171.1 hypothetical protein LTR92_005301 [Exophiala xenobiotica]KAK5209754.1 hypothetical protein LTR41_004386 [Exophiala xenobiotica]
MLRLVTIAAVGAFATTQVFAQTADFTADMTWGPATVGQVLPIYFTVGDGTPVSLFFGNMSWNEPVATNIAANLGEYDWTITVPDSFVPGEYGVGIVQSGSSNFSPLFVVSAALGGAAPTMPMSSSTSSSSMMIVGAPITSSTTTPMSTTMMPTVMPNATLISAAAEPTVTVTYFDPECSCHKTSAMPANAAATGGMPGTTYTWYDNSCGCTKTAMAPAPTMAASNNTVPAVISAGTNVPPPPPSTAATVSSAPATTYTGDASRLMNSGLAIVALVAAAVLA